jgi:hypothetical protein
MIGPVTVAVVMAAVAIEGLGIAAHVACRARATEIAAGVRSGTAIGVAATTVVGERARAARAAP